jgi:hypothetical protein
MTCALYSQDLNKAYLSIYSEEFKKEHIIKEDKLVRIWINDSTSYLGFLEFEDSLTIGVKDTLIETKDITQIKARHKRRTIAAIFTIISPTFCGVLVDGILMLSDVYGPFTFFPATGIGLYGSAIGAVLVCFVLDRRIYIIDEGVKVEIRSAS